MSDKATFGDDIKLASGGGLLWGAVCGFIAALVGADLITCISVAIIAYVVGSIGLLMILMFMQGATGNVSE